MKCIRRMKRLASAVNSYFFEEDAPKAEIALYYGATAASAFMGAVIWLA